MDCGLRDAYDFHHKPVFLQEWADYWNSGANQQVEAAYLQSMYAVWGQLVRESKMDGFGYWGGWPSVNESLLATDFSINYRGEALGRFFKSSS